MEYTSSNHELMNHNSDTDTCVMKSSAGLSENVGSSKPHASENHEPMEVSSDSLEGRLNPPVTETIDKEELVSRKVRDSNEGSSDTDLNSNKNNSIEPENTAPSISADIPLASTDQQSNGPEESSETMDTRESVEKVGINSNNENNSASIHVIDSEDSCKDVSMDTASKNSSTKVFDSNVKKGNNKDVNNTVKVLGQETSSKDTISVENNNSCQEISNKDDNACKKTNEKENSAAHCANSNSDTTDVIEATDKSIPEEENSNKDEGSELEGLRIDMVTSLESSSDVFVEPPSGPMSPIVVMTNPLESDADETTDSVISTKTSEKPDGDSEEVITGDKIISSEYVKNNVSSDRTTVIKDHGYSKKVNGPLSSQTSVGNDEPEKKRNTKVIFPKKFTEVNQLKVVRMPPVAKNCVQCAKQMKCSMQISIGGSDFYLCSDDCLKQHKQAQLNTLQRKNSTAVPIVDDDTINDCRLCVNCDTNISILPQDKVLSWEAMEFCNEDCLGKYQTKMWSYCTACKKDVPTASMGKYCVRFGHEVKQFCCATCLEEFKKGIKVCSYCQKDLSGNEEGFLAPLGEKGQFKDFCSQTCLDEYYCMSNNLPGVLLKVDHCSVCDKSQLVQLQIISKTGIASICSEVCLAAYKFVNKMVSAVPCYMCKKYFDKTMGDCVTVYYENNLLSFCSKPCMNINILAKRKIVACNWCKVKKYNFDMIRKKFANGSVGNWCSVNCMTLYNVSMNAISHRSKTPCTQCKNLAIPELHLTMSDATVRNFCSRPCVNAFQQTFGNAGSQNGGVVPTDQILPAIPSPAQQVPVIQSVGSTKKTGEIKIISPAAVNGTVSTASLLPPVPPSAIQTTPQCVKQSILVIPPLPPSVSNAKVQVKPSTMTKAVSVSPDKTNKGCQTDKEEVKGPILIPVPVPIFVPCPMAMYSVPVPTPFPFPIPVPVPIIIPTTRGTAEEIFADIKRIQEQIPGNPYEAELIVMAEIAEGEKKITEGNDTSLDKGDGKRSGQKRPGCSVEEDEVDRPPDKKRKEDNDNEICCDALDGTVNHLATSPGRSLKENLCVCAWRHFARQNDLRGELLEMRPEELAQGLLDFLKNAKIPIGGQYTPDQKYYIMLGIQYYLHANERKENIFVDRLFQPFIDALNEEAKHFQTMFSPCDNIITRVEEEHLWDGRELGPQSPLSLLATLIYFNTKCFNLTTVEEHMQLSFNHIMKHWKRPLNTPPVTNSERKSTFERNVLLRFYTPQSALDANPKKKRVYEQESNVEYELRCPVNMYEFYLSKCPESVKSRNDLFYLSPERSCAPDSPIWYSTAPLLEEEVRKILNRLKMVKEINLAILSTI